MSLVVSKLRHAKPGFRATISRDWYIIDDERKHIVEGPFRNKSSADTRLKSLKGQSPAMTDQKRREETVEETKTTTREETKQEPGTGSERRPGRPADNADAKDEKSDE